MFVSKAELERRFARAFLDAIGLSVPITPLPAGTGPDFEFILDNHTLGLEVTRVYHESPAGKPDLRKLEGERDQILAGAHRRWEQLQRPPVTVYVTFVPRRSPGKSSTRMVVDQLVNLVMLNLPEVDGVRRLTSEWPTRDHLPESVVSLEVLRPSYHAQSYWFSPDGGIVPDLNPVHLQARIDSKDLKLARQPGAPAESWLLLVAEGSRSSGTFNFVPEALEHVYRSVFMKTYLFEAFSRRVVLLKTETSGTSDA
jgi:hypothetical protein